MTSNLRSVEQHLCHLPLPPPYLYSGSLHLSLEMVHRPVCITMADPLNHTDDPQAKGYLPRGQRATLFHWTEDCFHGYAVQ
ncbi:hypothetical protein DPEC_G00060380 [Dallia pectoralis]|uniref:Uncharacterized protein n=1 Tax=Dallia pectoralis TaxID=75939 RepID=A0ACC2H6T7_DALPE|nr:hypothetical protein DPEC_G00060380 [Dallia pectoralis]